MNSYDPYLDEIDEKWIQRSMPVNSEKYFIFQMISANKEDEALDLMTNFSFGLKLTIISLIIWLFSFICLIGLIGVDLMIRKKSDGFVLIDTDKLMNKALTKFKTKFSSSSIGIYLIFLVLHFFICKNIIQNCIKTNKVTIDVSSIIRDEQDIFRTKKVPFYLGKFWLIVK